MKLDCTTRVDEYFNRGLTVELTALEGGHLNVITEWLQFHEAGWRRTAKQAHENFCAKITRDREKRAIAENMRVEAHQPSSWDNTYTGGENIGKKFIYWNTWVA